MIGTLDEDVLCRRDGGALGAEICASSNHIWAGNAIKGFTDRLVGGVMWKGGMGGEKVE